MKMFLLVRVVFLLGVVMPFDFYAAGNWPEGMRDKLIAGTREDIQALLKGERLSNVATALYYAVMNRQDTKNIITYLVSLGSVEFLA